MRLLAAALLLLGGAVAVSANPPPLLVHDVKITGSDYPQTLSEYGFFANEAQQERPPERVSCLRLAFRDLGPADGAAPAALAWPSRTRHLARAG